MVSSKMEMRWRATGAGVFESTLVCQQVYRERFSNSSFLWSKNDFCIKRDGFLKVLSYAKDSENRTFAM